MTPDELVCYLDRIKFTDPLAPDLATLGSVQKRHMQTVPFENFDVFVGRPLDLSPQALYQKMVVGRRGGYCFELNTLYGSLLRSLGFSPQPVLGRVRLRNPKAVPPRNHLAHLVKVDGGQTYLTDVGFGGLTTRVPLSIDSSAEVDDGEGRVRLVQLSENEYQLERETDEGWAPQYSFETIPVHPSDIQQSNHFTETHSSSHFLRGRFIGLFTEEGRIGLYENQFTERVGPSVVVRRQVADGRDWEELVSDRFGVVLDYTEAERVGLFSPSE